MTTIRNWNIELNVPLPIFLRFGIIFNPFREQVHILTKFSQLGAKLFQPFLDQLQTDQSISKYTENKLENPMVCFVYSRVGGGVASFSSIHGKTKWIIYATRDHHQLMRHSFGPQRDSSILLAATLAAATPPCSSYDPSLMVVSLVV